SRDNLTRSRDNLTRSRDNLTGSRDNLTRPRHHDQPESTDRRLPAERACWWRTW
ncbi:MAG: hypothetical protein RL347_1295, partial [Actinomycetota bacterium]